VQCAARDGSVRRKRGSAATAIEYGLIAAGISLAIIAAVNGLGSKLNTKFSAINSSLK
jgi:pilus assembly protein Flp/PilA